MSVRATVRKSVILGGLAFSANKQIEFDESRVRQVTLPVAKEGQLTTRTDDDTGTLTMDDGHGISTGNLIDIYWDGGARRGVTAGTVSGNSVPFGAGGGEGAGNNLPSNLSQVTVQVVQQEAYVFEGDEADAIAVFNDGNGRAQVRFHDSGGEELALELEGKSVFIWDSGGGFSNPVTGDSLETIRLTHEDSEREANIRVGVAITN